MDILMVILRIIHIFSGIAWVGSTFFLFFYLTPTVLKLGADGGKVMRILLLDSNYAIVIPAAAILSSLSGVWMFARVADGDYLRSSHGIVLSIGALFGLLAAGHGLGVILPTIRGLQNVMRQMGAAGGPPSPEQLTTLQGLQRKMVTNTRIIFILMVIAVLGMSSFRYFEPFMRVPHATGERHLR
jgi:uncharacterized membrane protein